jgi:hypothetical protein
LLFRQREATMQEPPFVQVALDPALIKGIYDTCDQWCMYCPATARCLAFRCNPDLRSGSKEPQSSVARSVRDDIIYLKQLADADGRPTPEIDALLSNDPRALAAVIGIDDPLERMGRRYAQLSHAYLMSRRDYPFEMRPRATGPTPFEVFAWYHMMIAVKIYRALVSAAAAACGAACGGADALASAKVALIGMDRSLEALAALAAEDDDPRHELLQAHLRRLRRDVEARFPAARSVIRAGLDDCPDWGQLD